MTDEELLMTDAKFNPQKKIVYQHIIDSNKEREENERKKQLAIENLGSEYLSYENE